MGTKRGGGQLTFYFIFSGGKKYAGRYELFYVFVDLEKVVDRESSMVCFLEQTCTRVLGSGYVITVLLKLLFL